MLGRSSVDDVEVVGSWALQLTSRADEGVRPKTDGPGLRATPAIGMSFLR
jgi:hypothetical protein